MHKIRKLKTTKHYRDKSKKTKENGVADFVLGSKDTTLLRWQLSQTNLWIQHGPKYSLRRTVSENWQADSKMHIEMQRTYNSQNYVEKEEQS